MSFIEYEAALRSRSSQLGKLHEIIDWKKLEHILGKLGRSGFGPQCYEPIKLLKAMLLQNSHSLSDTQLEEALSLRLDSIYFSGLNAAVRDATTICRFRNTLVEQKKAKPIFKAINAIFIAHGLTLKPAETAIVDATIITAAARPSKVIELEPTEEDSCEPSETPTMQALRVRQSSNPDARWLKKRRIIWVPHTWDLRWRWLCARNAPDAGEYL
jgi:IS5 family transposase